MRAFLMAADLFIVGCATYTAGVLHERYRQVQWPLLVAALALSAVGVWGAA